MKYRWTNYVSTGVTAGLVLFLIVPIILSVLVGVSVNYNRGLSAGLTLKWVEQVLELYSETILRSLWIAMATLAITLVIGVPAAYGLVRQKGRIARIIEEVITLPVAIPGLALGLAMILTYGGFGEFRKSSLFLIVGHVLFTLPFMIRAVMAVLESIDWKTIDEGAASLGAPVWQRFFQVILPNVRQGVVAGALTVVTLSVGEFNMTMMMHTPMTKTLPVGLADAYATVRLELASAYTLVFLLMIIPLLVGMQLVANLTEKRA